MSNEQAYFVLAINTEFGIDTSIHTSNDSAKNRLYEHVQEWWMEEFENDDSAPNIDTLSPHDAIDYYFTCNNSGEYYNINENIVKG